jgi:hypothetical protein
MLVTKEHQEALVAKYVKDGHTTDECLGFVDGINAILEMVGKLPFSDVGLHYFSPSKDDSKFCTCGKYLTADCHKREL